MTEVDGKSLRAVVFGGSGMVGAAVLSECLADPEVEAVLAVGRSSCRMQHPKLRELLVPDLFELDAVQEDLRGYNACFFTLGASAMGLDEAAYTRINQTLVLDIGRRLLALNPGMAFCYLSGSGTDSSEKGPVMWARVKGRTENELLKLPFSAAVMFRLAGLVAVKGHPSSTRSYRMMYALVGPLMPLLARWIPGYVLTPSQLGQAMLRAARGLAPKPVLEPKDILALGSHR